LELSGKLTGEVKSVGGYGVRAGAKTHRRGGGDILRRGYPLEGALRPRFVLLEGRCSAAVIPYGKLSGMAEGCAQDPVAIAARPSCDHGGGGVCACAHPVAGAVEQRLAAAEVSPVAGRSGDQASVGGGGDEDGIGRVFWRHVGL